MDWYEGPPLLDHLESIEPEGEEEADAPFRMPVQTVIRAGWLSRLRRHGRERDGVDRRQYPGDAGRDPGDGRPSTVGGETQYFGVAGQSVAISFRSPVDCSRGDVLASAEAPPEVADQFEAIIVWMGDEDLLPGRQYGLKLAGQYALATLQPPKHEIDVDTSRADRDPDTGSERDRSGRSVDRQAARLRAL